MRSKLLVLLLLGGFLVPLGPGLAAASGELVLSRDVSIGSDVPKDSNGDPLYTDLLSLILTAGPDTPRALYARFVVYKPVDSTAVNVKHMAAGRIQCDDANGGIHSHTTTSQNIWVENSQLTLVTRMMFVPATHGTYTCKVKARQGAWCVDSEHEVCPWRNLVFKGGSGNTLLSWASPTWARMWGLERDTKHPAYVADGKSHVAATHIHTDLPPDPFIGNEEFVAKATSFVVPAGPASITAVAQIHMTSCAYGDTGCYEGARWLGGDPDEATSVVDLRIVATQLNPDGTECIQRWGPTSRLTILGQSHHQTANIVYNGIPISGCAGSRRFGIKTWVERVDGNPIRIEPGRVLSGNSFGGFSHSFVYYH